MVPEPNAQYAHGLSLFCPSCAAFGGDCPGGAFACLCVRAGADRLRCSRGEPCEVLCIERYDWPRHVRHPRLRPLWGGAGACGMPALLPAVIPCATLRMGLRPPPLPWLAVDARDLFELSPTRGRAKACTLSVDRFRAHLGVEESTQILAYLNGSDPRLEGLFAMGSEVGQILQRAGIALAAAPTFSVLAERPRLDQVFNLRRTFTLLGEIEEAGVPVFPNVYAGNEQDLEAWTRWLDERPHVWVVGVGIQRQRVVYFDDLVQKVVRLQRALPAREVPLHAILYGVGAPGRAARARSLGLRHFACVSSSAAMAAGHGRRLAWTGRRLVAQAEPGTPREELLRAGLRAQASGFASLPLDTDGYIVPAAI